MIEIRAEIVDEHNDEVPLTIGTAIEIAEKIISEVLPREATMIGWWDTSDGDHEPTGPAEVEFSENIEDLEAWFSENVDEKADAVVIVNGIMIYFAMVRDNE